MAEAKSENGSKGIRLLARKFCVEALDRCVSIMRNSPDDRAVAKACATIVFASLAQPVQELTDD